MEKHQGALHPKGTLIPDQRKKKSHSTVFQISDCLEMRSFICMCEKETKIH